MASDGRAVDRVRQFLRELKPEARALLIAELERAVLRGDDFAGADLVLNELRLLFREARGITPRISTTLRLFYRPIEPFMVDDIADHNHPYRIARASLMPIWHWIERELLPAEAHAFAEQAGDALIADDVGRANALARALQLGVADAIDQAFAAVADDERAARRLRSQIGTPLAQENGALIAKVFRHQELLEQFAAQLPIRISELSAELAGDIKNRIETGSAKHPDIFPHLLLLTMSRLASPWQLVRLAVRAAGSDHATRVAATSYSLAVTAVLAELSRLVNELKNELRSGRGIACGAMLKDIHDAARGLRTELDLPADSQWGRQLIAMRAQISKLLKVEIDSMPGRVRRLLRPRSEHDIRPGAVLDADDVAETQMLVDFVGACRHFASELAINEMTQRSFSDLQHYLENNTRTLIEALRHAVGPDRPFRQSQLDAAIRFCRIVFGADYAAMIEKSAATADGDAARAHAAV
jgi:hypothetical protein